MSLWSCVARLGATLLESSITGVEEIGTKEWKVKKVTESVSKDKEGIITITLNNLSIEAFEEIDIQCANGEYKVVEARIVTNSDMHAHNTFEVSDKVVEKDFTGYEIKNSNIVVKLPANSVVELRLQK